MNREEFNERKRNAAQNLIDSGIPEKIKEGLQASIDMQIYPSLNPYEKSLIKSLLDIVQNYLQIKQAGGDTEIAESVLMTTIFSIAESASLFRDCSPEEQQELLNAQAMLDEYIG